MKKIIVLLSLLNVGMTTDKPRREFYTSSKPKAVSFSTDGSLIAASFEGSMEVYHTRMGLRLKSFSTENLITDIDASPNEPNIVACADKSNSVVFWNIEKGEIQKKITLKDAIKSIEYQKDGREILVNTGKNVSFYEVLSGKKMQTFKTTNAVLMTYNQPSQILATSHPDNTITVWNLATNKKLFVLNKHKGKITQIAINKDGSQLISSSVDKTIRVWDLKTGQETKKIVYDSAFNCVVYDLNENHIISASDDKKTIVWDIAAETPTILNQYEGQSEAIFVSRHPKEQILLSGYNDTVLQTWLMK
ncbi:MAG: WD40 repeat domain-containing protein [Emticicia sp.]|uniref:WD40 repeat domain-containing protein n=1 Tax=Emticicia sp. TaxID=1930953 RepID=UPI003BA7ABA8